MLSALRRKTKPSARKLRLFAVAGCRCLDAFLDERARQALNVAERFADEVATTDELAAVHQTTLVTNRPRPRRRTFAERQAAAYDDTITSHAWDGIEGATRLDQAIPTRVMFAAQVLELVPPTSPRGAAFDPVVLAGIFRDIFGNPFRSVTLDHAWLTWNDGTVPKLAQAIYDERGLPSGHLDSGRLAILADALEDSGCTDKDILEHCRGPGPHVRGFWVVDLLLGKV